MRNLYNRLAATTAIILLIGVLGYLSGNLGSMEWLVDNEFRMRGFVQQHQWQSWFLGLGIYTVFSLVPGTVGKAVVWGWLFGFWPAVAIVDAGLTIAAVASFLAARFIIRDAARAQFHGLIEKFDSRVSKDGAFLLLIMRMAHVPYSFVNYGVGATSIRTWTFTWTTAMGLLPSTMIFVFVGTRIPTLASLAEKGAWQLLDPLLMSLFVAAFVFPIGVRRIARQYKKYVGSDSDVAITETEQLNKWTTRG